MGLLHIEKKRIFRYGVWKIDEDEDELRKILGDDISSPHLNPGKRIEFLAVRALAKVMHIKPQSIAYQPSGKPYLTGNNTHLSISHTKGYAAIMLSDMENIGIDIERKSDRILKVRHKFISPEEELNISVHPGNEIISLLLHWSAKESLFKAISDEGVDFIKELRIYDFTSPTEKGSFKAKALRSDKDFLINYCVSDDYVLTTCIPLLH